MKIDLHCHTDNSVQGDINRFCSTSKFREVITENNIEIIAITNHNEFLPKRYEELKNAVSDVAQLWPGIELTVDAGSGERHMIIVSSPKHVDEFEANVSTLLKDVKPDDVCIDLKELKGVFNSSHVVYIVHYHDKTKKFYDSEIENLLEILSSDDLVFLEPTNITSMGIFLDHNMRSIIGSDVTDWNKYPIEKIPELRLKVEDFESFRLLATKDKRIVNKLLADQDNFKVKIASFWNRDFTFYKDINILFGGKGTGKSILAEEIYKYLNVNEDKKVKYFNSEKSSIQYEDSIGIEFNGNEYNKFITSNLSSEINYIKDWQQSNPTSIKKYFDWGEKTTAKELSDKFSFINMTFEELIDDSKYLGFIESYIEFHSLKDIYEKIELDGKIKIESKEQLEKVYMAALFEFKLSVDDLFVQVYSKKLLRKTIDIMKRAVLEKKQIISKPETVGFYDFYTNRKNVIEKVERIKNFFELDNVFEKSKLGEIEFKGEIFLRKEIIVNPKTIKEITYSGDFGKVKVNKIIDSVNSTFLSSFKTTFTQELSILKGLLEDYKIVNINCLIGRKNSTVLADLVTLYEPSKGEKHMLALNNIILQDYEIFILDEPTVGLGHEYVSNKILPQLKKLVKQGKSYIIVTHDANIGVRSLPYQSVYMQYDNDDRDFYVYEGNPFENVLYEIRNRKEPLKWNFIAQSVLEGGEVAFIERRKIYGKE